jgi:hypothetical protein
MGRMAEESGFDFRKGREISSSPQHPGQLRRRRFLKHSTSKNITGAPEINGTYHLLVHANDVNLLGDNIGAVKKNIETFN